MALKSLAERISRLRGRPAPVPDLSSPAPRDIFLAWAEALGSTATVLEIGTKRSVGDRSTHLQRAFPRVPRENYLMADVQDGADVDVIADLHGLPEAWVGRFDAVVAIAVFEHLERPWLAAREIDRVLKPGGRCYIATHQTFPLHGYPSDFFRFSREALTLLFEDAGLEVLDCAYEHRTWILLPDPLVPRARRIRRWVDAWNRAWPSYINVHLAGRKPPAGPQGAAIPTISKGPPAS